MRHLIVLLLLGAFLAALAGILLAPLVTLDINTPGRESS